MKTILSVFIFSLITASLFGQEEDNSSDKINNLSAVITVQNKGISTIPNLTLGDPAVIFDLKIGRKLTFEPQFRFSLKDGKPWAIVLWGRYYATLSEKFKMTIHANHSFSYKAITLFNADGTERDVIRTNRYMVGALSPNYQLNKYIGIGAYLFYSYGMDPNMTKNTFMYSFRPAFSNIPITKKIVANAVPEVYLLKMDNNEGFFFNSRFQIKKKSSPFSFSALVNKPIHSNIQSEYDFLWNVGVSYTFNKKYREIPSN